MRFPIGESDILCMDWDERYLRILNASYSRRGSVQVRSAVFTAIPPEVEPRNPQSFGEFVKRTLGEHRIRTRRVIMDVPRHDAVLNMMSLPKGSVDELAAMVNIQIARELPFNRDQMVIDFAVEREDAASPNNDVWVAAVRSNVVEYYKQVVEHAGLRLERLGLRPYANLVAFTHEGAAAGRLLTVDVGPSMTEISVIRDGHLVYSRAASVSIPPEGLHRETAAPPSAPPAPASAGDSVIPFVDDTAPRLGAMDSLLVEVSRTIEAYRATDPGARVDAVLLAGTGGIDERVVEAFQNRFNVETSIFRIPESLRWRGDRDQAAPFSAVVGLAISGVGDGLRHFNFVHPKEPEGERRERVKRVPYLAIGAAAIVALLITAAYMPIHRRNARIEELRAQIAALSADEKARKELTNQLADIELWQKRNVVWLDTMREIAENIFTTNKDAYLTRLDFSEDGSVRMELLAAHNEVAPELVRAAWQLRDKNGKPVYSGDVGDWDDKGKNEKYPITDELRLKLNALAAKPAKKK